jgi:hypothetical protein
MTARQHATRSLQLAAEVSSANVTIRARNTSSAVDRLLAQDRGVIVSGVCRCSRVHSVNGRAKSFAREALSHTQKQLSKAAWLPEGWG